MENLLLEIRAELYFIIGLLLMVFAPALIHIAIRVSRLEGHPIRDVIPAVTDYTKRNFQLAVKGLKRVRHLKNKGKETTPDVPEWMVTVMVRYLIRELSLADGDNDKIEKIPLSETVWIRDGKWKELASNDATAEQWRDVMARLETKRVISRKGGKNSRVLALPYRSLFSKLRTLLPREDEKQPEMVAEAG